GFVLPTPATISLFNYCNQPIIDVSRRRLEWQTFAGIALAVHSGPSPVIVWPVVRGLLRTCPALAASSSQMPPSFPPAGPAHPSAGGFRGPLSPLARYHSADRPMRRTAIYVGHIARVEDRSALRQLDARGLGFSRQPRARQSRAPAFLPPLIILD